MKDDDTHRRTLWSLTMLDMLIDALRQERSDAEINEIVEGMKDRGFKAQELVDEASTRVSRKAALRLYGVLKARRIGRTL